MDKKKIEFCAWAAHEMNRIYSVSTGDLSHKPWEEAPDWQKISSAHGVEQVLLKGATPEQLHYSWMKEKLSTGWTYGTVKDPEAKTHPCLVPYAELPANQRVKDALYQQTVLAMAAALEGIS